MNALVYLIYLVSEATRDFVSEESLSKSTCDFDSVSLQEHLQLFGVWRRISSCVYSCLRHVHVHEVQFGHVSVVLSFLV